MNVKRKFALYVFMFLIPTVFTFPSISSAAEGNSSEVNWTEKVRVSGDIRYRHDYVRQSQKADRHRERLRLRATITGQVNEDIKAKVRLASAESQDPISTNQSMTENSNKKPINIDVASIDWKFLETSTLTLGKQDNSLRPISSSQLVYDTDYTPEGAAVQNKMGDLFLNAAGFSLQERGPDSNGHSRPDTWLLAGVLGYKSEMDEGTGFQVALGYHNFTGVKKNTALTNFSGNSSDTVAGTGYYRHDYQVAEVAAEFHTRMDGMGVSVYADAIQNLNLSDDNKGLTAGLSVSTLKDDGKANWSLGYAYLTVDKDATVSSINNSDFANGNDGAFGHMVSVSKSVAQNVGASLTYYKARVDNNGSPYWTERALADLLFTF